MTPTLTAVVIFLVGCLLALLTATVSAAFWAYWLAFLLLTALLLGVDAILGGGRLERVEAELEAPKLLYVGAEHPVRLLLRNRSGGSVLARLRVDLSPPLKEIPEILRALVPPGHSAVDLSLCAERRGQARVESLWLRATGPLGLMAFTRSIPLDHVLQVTPNLELVSRNAIRMLSTRSLQHGVKVERHRGDGTEFDHLREYEPGFDIRTIDWKASARHAKMLCRELRAERNRQVIVAIDAGRLMIEPLDGIPKLDHAITAGLSLGTISLNVGDWVSLVSFDDRLRQYCPPVKGKAGVGNLTRTAARIDYSNRETNFTLFMMELSLRCPRRALVVVMTDFVDSITAELMVENLERLAKRHLILFVAMQDPGLHDLAATRPANMLRLHRAVVAHSLLNERETVIRRLRRRGIHCIDTAPAHISAEMIDRYLAFKRKEAF